MDLEVLEKFFLWCMLVNTGVYLLTAVSVFALRGFVHRVHRKMFNMDEEAIDASIQRYLGNYKLLITAFNFAPWLALVIIT